jgi:uncharacterized protein
MKHKSRNILIGVVATLVVAYFAVGLACYLVVGNVRGSCGQSAVNRPDKILFTDNWPPIDLQAYAISPYETVRFPSRQPGINIAGYWAEAKPGAPAVILVHGLGGCKNAIDVLVPAGMLWRNGFNVLLIDVRDVGDSDSEDGWTSAGNDESLDVLGAWDWLVTTKGYAPERIGLFGVSMGGATSLYAFQDESRIAALFLEGTFASLVATVAYQLTGYGLPGFLAQPAAAVFRLVSNENIMAHTPITAIRSAGSRPVYIVHSRGDRRISISQSHELAAAALDAGVNVRAWFPERSEHLQTPALYPEEFERRLVGFFRETLGD